MIYMFLSNNPLSGDINSSNLPCWKIVMLTNLYEDCKVSYMYYHIRPDKYTVSMTSGG